MTALARPGAASEDLAAVARFIRLPHGGLSAELMMAPGDDLCINMDDWRDYYYLLRWREAMERSSAVGPALQDEDLEALGVSKSPGQVWFAVRPSHG